jgi:hypothetical protein
MVAESGEKGHPEWKRICREEHRCGTMIAVEDVK